MGVRSGTPRPPVRRFLFVCGAPRHGTTALAELVGSHHRIVLGVERFKELWATDRIDEFGPEQFQRDRFFDFSDGLTNITPEKSPKWREYYRGAADKFDLAAFVGDKLMRPNLDSIIANFPDVELLCIVRHLHGVASSWDRRARNPRDVTWPESWDALASVAHWNRMNAAIAEARRRQPDRVSVVDFRTVFESALPLRSFFHRIGLDWDVSIDAEFERTRDSGARLQQRDRSLPADVASSLDDRGDWATWDLLQRAAELDSGRTEALASTAVGTRAPTSVWRGFATLGRTVRSIRGSARRRR